jgi:hypothetical protein
MLDIDKLTIAEAKELLPKAKQLLGMFGEASPDASNQTSLPYPVGTPVYVRGAIYSVCGRIQGRDGEWLCLSEASYVGTDGQFSVASSKGLQEHPNSEIEPVGGDRTMRVNIGAISDVSVHPEPLPEKVK